MQKEDWSFRIAEDILGEQHYINPAFLEPNRKRTKRNNGNGAEYKTLLEKLTTIKTDSDNETITKDEAIMKARKEVQSSSFYPFPFSMDRLMTLHARKKNCDKNVNELKSWYTTLKSVSQRIKEDGSSTEQYTTEDAMFEEFKKNCLEHVNQMITETVEKYHAAVDEQERVVEKCLKIEKQMVGIVSLVQLYESILEEKEKSETSRL